MALMGQYEPQRSFESYPVGALLSIIGHFDWKIYENPENGFKIYTFDIEKIIDNDGSEFVSSDSISVTGYYEVNEHSGRLPCKVFGSISIYKGEKQLVAERVEFIEPTTLEGIIAFLGSGMIKGIGEKTARRIVIGYSSKVKNIEGFGEGTLGIIKNDHLQLTRIKGISASKAQLIHDSYMENMEYQNVMLFFQKYGITPNKAMKIYNAFRGRSNEIALENPFMFQNIKGFGFKTCDEIARKIGLDPHSEHRIEAGIKHTLEMAELEGHCYLLKSKLVSMARENLSILLPLNEARRSLIDCKTRNQEKVVLSIGGLTYSICVNDLDRKLETARMERQKGNDMKVIIDEITTHEILNVIDKMLKFRLLIEYKSSENSLDSMIYNFQMYNIEMETSNIIRNIALSEPINILAPVDNLIKDFEDLKGFQLENRQREAIKAVFNTNMLILTGSAGSGKTTTVEGMIYVLGRVFGTEEENLSYMLAAPTGKAAKRLTEVTGFEAKTIHRLLQYSFESEGFYYKAGNPLPYKLVVIDEASMLDINLANGLFNAISVGTKVILIGDVQQLPSVGAGNVLNDMINSGMVKVVELDVIKRQADGSGIITNANKIIRGEMPESDLENKDFFIIEEYDRCKVVKKTLDAVSRLMSAYNYLIDDIQVICPQKTSEIGTYEMNKAVQHLVNPPSYDKLEIKRGNNVFRVGDKVIHLNNNYEAPQYIRDPNTGNYELKSSLGVFNGDIGKIIDIYIANEDDDTEGTATTKIAVQYDDFVILYEKPDLEDIDLAYSLTVHKMQGSQCEAAVILCHLRNHIMLNRNLGYTAVTRAKRMVCVIGQRKAISVMVQNVKVTQRNTMLAKLLSFENNSCEVNLFGNF